jgi:glutamate racemase
MNASSPIGIFDSGIGGLTVVQSVMKALPNETVIYFGDSARVPYGVKSPETINRYAAEITEFLKNQDVKMILIACNTVSAVAGETVHKIAGNIPVLDVLSAGAKAATNTGSSNIGVIGTLATINSGAYSNSIRNLNPAAEVKSKACPLLVPLAEEGWTKNDIARETLKIYLSDFMDNGIDTLILGCTHYPLFKESIIHLFGEKNISVIDSGDAISDMARNTLKEKNLLNTSEKTGEFRCFVSDRPQRFQELAERFLGTPIDSVNTLSL